MSTGVSTDTVRQSRRSSLIVLALVVAALLVAGVLSYYASSNPDGLNRVAEDKQFSSLEQAHGAEDSPLAGYAVRGVDNERISVGLAGIAGVALTFLLGSGVFLAVRRRRAT
jgi:hypothetical protein